MAGLRACRKVHALRQATYPLQRGAGIEAFHDQRGPGRARRGVTINVVGLGLGLARHGAAGGRPAAQTA
jgi:hypothetical protein